MIFIDERGAGICVGCQQPRTVDAQTCMCDECLIHVWHPLNGAEERQILEELGWYDDEDDI